MRTRSATHAMSAYSIAAADNAKPNAAQNVTKITIAPSRNHRLFQAGTVIYFVL
jgi:hypothetical protein